MSYLLTVFIIFYALLLSFFVPTIMSLFFFSQTLDFFLVFAYCCQNLVRLFFASQLVLSSLAISSRFKMMNKHLKESTRITKRLQSFSLNFKPSSYLKLYHHLCDAIEIVNNSLTFPLVLIFPALMVRIVFLKFKCSEKFNFSSGCEHFRFVSSC